MTFALETERLSLRLRDRSDAEWNLELKGEHEGGTTLTLAEEQQRLVDQRANALESGIGLLTIRRRLDDEALGYCGLIIGRCSFDEPEIAYELLRRFHGNGYATEAAKAVMDAAFQTGRRRLWSTVGSWNTPSFRVLEKLGFVRDHTEADARGEHVYMRCDGRAS